MKATYKIEIEFSGEVSEKGKEQIVDNILNALVSEANSVGLVPEDEEEFTTKLKVTRNFYTSEYKF